MVQAAEVAKLREAWIAQGNPPCDHPKRDREYYLGGDTGDVACLVCGETWARGSDPPPTHRQVVQEVVTELRRYLAAYRGSLTTERAARWDEVIAQLDEAAALLDPEREGGPSPAARPLIEEAERVLRTELGQTIGAPFEPQDLRYAALDGHKRLYRQVLT